MTGGKNKDNRKTWFVTLAIVIAGVTFLNIFLYSRNDETGDVKQLKVRNQVLQTENEELKKKVKETLPSEQEQERQSYLSAVEKFIQLSFHREKQGYEERREQAKKLMKDEVFQLFYPTDTFEMGDTYVSKPSDMKLYLQDYKIGASQVEVIAEFKNTVTIGANGTTDKTKNVMKVTVQKNQESWQVTNVEELAVQIIAS
ncbi:MerR family transcriptional regulator [Bacillus pseudomycoides]|uniref:MerR family transcriptional regulator n=1 Tax=Bacillus pseudomycoides TaxID=64104 RepID=UPI000BF7ABB0|nr:MerR family transcriptional regulator [Bacillus pseudomycoides]MBD5798216.1 MerR family transcriptional regulator [Bacillus pseudomycoides]MED1477017.1 MerR family transcriptional regulator [Bacillus pseudomycoides]PEO85152.1 MerR family transcriptional regulator [Bacillus pseudomycoides]